MSKQSPVSRNFPPELRTTRVLHSLRGKSSPRLWPLRMPGADYYKILGVARDADAEDLKKAYRKLALKCV